MTLDELKKEVSSCAAFDTTDDNALSNKVNDIIEELDRLSESMSSTTEEVQRLKEANTSLKAKNFDLLSKIGNEEKHEEADTVNLNTAIDDFFK